MADEDKQNVEEKEGTSHPETVPWTQYIGVKEKLGRIEKDLGTKVQSLEEQLSKAVKQDDFSNLQAELEKAKTSYQQAQDELKKMKELGLESKRSFLKSKGIPEDKYKEASAETLDAMIAVLESYQPKPDFGSGGGTGVLKGSPMELARQAYSNSK